MLTLSLFKLKQGLFRPFKHFRKNLPLDYKKGGKHDHKNPHAIPLKVKDRLLNSKKGGDWKKIRQLQRQSLKPYGRFTKTGFRFQKQKLPFYDIPNIDGFQLKPYVQYLTPKVQGQKLTYQKDINNKKLRQIQQINKKLLQ